MTTNEEMVDLLKEIDEIPKDMIRKVGNYEGVYLDSLGSFSVVYEVAGIFVLKYDIDDWSFDTLSKRQLEHVIMMNDIKWVCYL